MKIFETGGKINFVDDKNLFVGFDFEQDCCESFGFFIRDTQEADIPENWPSVDINDYSGYNFDPAFFAETGYDGTSLAIFKLKKGRKVKYLHIFNCHNGWYAHGFQFCNGETVIREGNL